MQIAGSMMGTQPLPPHQQPGGGGPLGLKKQQEFLGNMSSSIYQLVKIKSVFITIKLG